MDLEVFTIQLDTAEKEARDILRIFGELSITSKLVDAEPTMGNIVAMMTARWVLDAWAKDNRTGRLN